jgi:hypothetical protein
MKRAGPPPFFRLYAPVRSADAENHLGLRVFDAATIEESKQAFVTSSGAVAVFANRYDGIDFSGRRMSVVVY